MESFDLGNIEIDNKKDELNYRKFDVLDFFCNYDGKKHIANFFFLLQMFVYQIRSRLITDHGNTC
jgi:hypothetical protein